MNRAVHNSIRERRRLEPMSSKEIQAACTQLLVALRLAPKWQAQIHPRGGVQGRSYGENPLEESNPRCVSRRDEEMDG